MIIPVCWKRPVGTRDVLRDVLQPWARGLGQGEQATAGGTEVDSTVGRYSYLKVSLRRLSSFTLIQTISSPTCLGWNTRCQSSSLPVFQSAPLQLLHPHPLLGLFTLSSISSTLLCTLCSCGASRLLCCAAMLCLRVEKTWEKLKFGKHKSFLAVSTSLIVNGIVNG